MDTINIGRVDTNISLSSSLLCKPTLALGCEKRPVSRNLCMDKHRRRGAGLYTQILVVYQSGIYVLHYSTSVLHFFRFSVLLVRGILGRIKPPSLFLFMFLCIRTHFKADKDVSVRKLYLCAEFVVARGLVSSMY